MNFQWISSFFRRKESVPVIQPGVDVRRQELIDRELKELVAMCIEEEDSMTLREKEFFAKNKVKILDEIPSRILKRTIR
ncbi:MAG: hypothetical protein PHG66_01090 [Candidatus Colwellbacteria bacterium]|nr:hypothetical protein [Candidatus Colwellbacteria bacterium]